MRWFYGLMLIAVAGLFSEAFSQTITGTVTSASDGSPLVGTSIVLKGTSKGTVTDAQGKYLLEVNQGDTLIFSFVGYKTRIEPINGRSVIDVALEQDVTLLEEVVAVVYVAYGTQKKSDLTGSVGSLRDSELTKMPLPSAEMALQGKIAGVQVTNASGAPGDVPIIRIRGVGTLNNSSPIFVVDGVILENIAFLNPADIASIEVLKDASATALYGSRGANGVVLITTKKGKEGKPVAQLQMEYGWQSVAKTIDMMKGREFAELVNELAPGTFNNLDKVADVDWQKQIFRKNAPISSYNFSLSGGSDKISYYLAAGYNKQQGLIPKSSFERYSFKINNSYKLTSKITIGHNFTLAPANRQNTANAVAAAYRAWPTDPPYQPNGVFAEVRGSGNPLAAIEFTNSYVQAIRSVGNIFLDYAPFKDLVLKTSYGFDYINEKSENFTPAFFVSPTQQNPLSDLNKSQYDYRLWIWENTISYYKKLTPYHRFDVLLGLTMQQDKGENFSASAKNLIRDNREFWYVFVNDNPRNNLSNSALTTALASYLARINYAFKDRYLLTATYRIDGSSKFGRNNLYGHFPSLALGWLISEEQFLQDIELLSRLKIRGSWGRVGNEKIPPYDRLALVNTGLFAVFNEQLQQGSTLGLTANPNLRWETTAQTDIGIELGLWDEKFTLELDYYRRLTTDILVDLTTPGHTGNGAFTRIRTNAASVINRGFELSGLYSGIGKGGFSYKIGANFTTVKNVVTKLGADKGSDSFITSGSLGNGQNVTRTEVGKQIGSFYGYKVIGVFQNTNELANSPTLPGQQVGDLKFADLNGDGKITDADRTHLGSAIPDGYYGFYFEVAYKGIDFSADFQGMFGNEIYNGKKAVRPDIYNFEASVRNRWISEGSSNSEPRITNGGPNFQPSSYFVEKGDFFRLRTLSLGYTIPKKIATKINISQIKAYLRATNLFTKFRFSGYSPDILGAGVLDAGIDLGVYPIGRIFSMGINFSF